MSLTSMLALHNLAPMSKAYPPHVAQIRAVMAAKGVTQEQLAQALDLAQSSVSRRLAGSQPFRTDELDAVARHLGTRLVINLEDVA